MLPISVSRSQAPAADQRVDKLVNFFKTYDCPQPYHVTSYLRAADSNGVDYRLLPVISVLESSCGKYQRKNNHWGWNSANTGFSSVSAGIDFITKELTRGYFKNRDTQQKLAMYNPRPIYSKLAGKLMREFNE